MSPDPDISVEVNVRNPGQFFACCGLLEVSSRIWPDSEGWFEITGRRTTYHIVIGSGHGDPLAEIVRGVSEPETVTEIDAEHYDPGLRPLMLAAPLDIRLDWWIENGVNKKSSLKLWAGQQTPLRIMTDMQTELQRIKPGRNVFNTKQLMSGRFGLDAASSWTARGLGFSPDEQDMSWPTYPVTEMFAAIGLQRCRPLPIKEKGRWFFYHIWNCPLGALVLAAAASMGKGQIAAKYMFEKKMRGNYGMFMPWTEEEAKQEDAMHAK